jgi:hypothetical protein
MPSRREARAADIPFRRKPSTARRAWAQTPDIGDQTHDVPNLFIAGGSRFSTTGALAATFTVNAVALRTLDFDYEKLTSLVG